MVTPDILSIIQKSLSVGKNLMFYLPRLIDINELFELINEVTQQDILFLDIHILESANKIKAILFMFGPNVSQISKFEMENFITMITKESNLTDLKEDDLNCEGKENNESENSYTEITTITRKNSTEYKSPYINVGSNEESLSSMEKGDENKKENSIITEKGIQLSNVQEESTSNQINPTKEGLSKSLTKTVQIDTLIAMNIENHPEEYKISSNNPYNEICEKKLCEIPTSTRKCSEKEQEVIKVLMKIYSVVGMKKFFEGMIKYKEKFESEDLKKKFKLYIPTGKKPQELINFFFNEILTEKQISRLNL